MNVLDLPAPLDELLNGPVPPRRLSPVDVETLGVSPSAWGPVDVLKWWRPDGVELNYFRLIDIDRSEHYLIRDEFRRRMGWAP